MIIIYISNNYVLFNNNLNLKSVGTTQSGICSSLLANLYLISFQNSCNKSNYI